ncbi:hypothetical protein [Nostoc sp. DedQUE09]|uniref:hypothetical protein n=1 Tax=Nostoc sp. DedQUE09 TaxID=3075394 RepID=UPI002AD46998|nr:hypothetical protein [Nostoc sp. DedQUE09]MDZ7953776.1 hypothetical protein [Nostoc sp. DedQUE09]
MSFVLSLIVGAASLRVVVIGHWSFVLSLVGGTASPNVVLVICRLSFAQEQ